MRSEPKARRNLRKLNAHGMRFADHGGDGRGPELAAAERRVRIMNKIATLTTNEAAIRITPPPLVTLRNVHKVFANQVTALEGLNLDVRAGEFLSLLGPSGCGKSTVLRLLAGLAGPTRGEIVWLTKCPELGFVFQEPTLTPWSDVFTNVWLPLRLAAFRRKRLARESRRRSSKLASLVSQKPIRASFPAA